MRHLPFILYIIGFMAAYSALEMSARDVGELTEMSHGTNAAALLATYAFTGTFVLRLREYRVYNVMARTVVCYSILLIVIGHLFEFDSTRWAISLMMTCSAASLLASPLILGVPERLEVTIRLIPTSIISLIFLLGIRSGVEWNLIVLVNVTNTTIFIVMLCVLTVLPALAMWGDILRGSRNRIQRSTIKMIIFLLILEIAFMYHSVPMAYLTVYAYMIYLLTTLFEYISTLNIFRIRCKTAGYDMLRERTGLGDAISRIIVCRSIK